MLYKYYIILYYIILHFCLFILYTHIHIYNHIHIYIIYLCMYIQIHTPCMYNKAYQMGFPPVGCRGWVSQNFFISGSAESWLTPAEG